LERAFERAPYPDVFARYCREGWVDFGRFFTVPTEVPLRIVRYLPKVQKIARKKNFTQ
jgi:hypothetical protein